MSSASRRTASRTRRTARPIAGIVGALLLGIVCSACAPEPAPTPAPTDATAPAPTEAVAAPEILPFPTGESASTTPLPTDCTELLTDEVRDEIGSIPLNAPGMGGGIREDSSRVCVWADPAATRTRLIVVVGYAPEREASDTLYLLGRDEGYFCYDADGGSRCEATWEDPEFPVEQGRTLFYRDGVVIDTQYAGLAPEGFTSSIIATVWPDTATT